MNDWNEPPSENLPMQPHGNLPAMRPDNLISVEEARAVQEVQAAMIVAKKFPRDVDAAYARVMKACQRKSLAERAVYKYQRGGGNVEGASIRMAEEIARNFGNIDYGIKILERRGDESTAMAYCWDLETNTRQTRIFQVKHIRDKRGGGQKLTEERDIYEIVANMGARRLRACILGVIPADIVEDALIMCKRTISAEAARTPIDERRRKTLVAFDSVGVNQAMLERHLKHPFAECSHDELTELTTIFNAIRDGIGKREDYFEFQRTETPAAVNINDRLRGTNGNQSNGEDRGTVHAQPGGVIPGPGEGDGRNQGQQLDQVSNAESGDHEAIGATTRSDAPASGEPDADRGAVNGSGNPFVRSAPPGPGGPVAAQSAPPAGARQPASSQSVRSKPASASPKQAPAQKAPDAQSKPATPQVLTHEQQIAGDYVLKFGINFGKPLKAVADADLATLWRQLRANAEDNQLSGPAHEALTALNHWCPTRGLTP